MVSKKIKPVDLARSIVFPDSARTTARSKSALTIESHRGFTELSTALKYEQKGHRQNESSFSQQILLEKSALSEQEESLIMCGFEKCSREAEAVCQVVTCFKHQGCGKSICSLHQGQTCFGKQRGQGAICEEC